jgi:hypothetical protein
MLRRVDLVRTDILEEHIASIIKVTMEAIRSYETCVITRSSRRNIPVDVILNNQSIRRS